MTLRRACLRSAYSVCMPLVQRARPVERDERHQVLEPVGLEHLDQRAHARGLHLEDPGRVGVPEHRVRRRVVQRHVVDVELDAAGPQMANGVVDHRQGPQPEEVHLQQAERLDAVHVELRHDPLRVVARVLRRASAGGSSRAARRRSRRRPRAPSPRGADPRAPARCRRSPSPRAPSRRPRGAPAIPSARPRSGSRGPSRWAGTSCRGGRRRPPGTPARARRRGCPASP